MGQTEKFRYQYLILTNVLCRLSYSVRISATHVNNVAGEASHANSTLSICDIAEELGSVPKALSLNLLCQYSHLLNKHGEA